MVEYLHKGSCYLLGPLVKTSCTPTQKSTSGISPRAARSDITGTFILDRCSFIVIRCSSIVIRYSLFVVRYSLGIFADRGCFAPIASIPSSPHFHIFTSPHFTFPIPHSFIPIFHISPFPHSFIHSHFHILSFHIPSFPSFSHSHIPSFPTFSLLLPVQSLH